MQILTRQQYCQLTKLDIDALKTLRRRDQIPKPEGTGPEESYTPFSALLMLIADEFAQDQKIHRIRATWIASQGSVIQRRWEGISATSESLFYGMDVPEEIMLAILERPGEYPEAVCGTLREIAASCPNPARITLCNVTRAAAVLRMRAHRNDIDLQDFWCAK